MSGIRSSKCMTGTWQGSYALALAAWMLVGCSHPWEQYQPIAGTGEEQLPPPLEAPSCGSALLLAEDFEHDSGASVEPFPSGLWSVKALGSVDKDILFDTERGNFAVGFAPGGTGSWHGTYGSSGYYSLVDRSVEVEIARAAVDAAYPGYHVGRAYLEVASAGRQRTLRSEVVGANGPLGLATLRVRYARKKVGSGSEYDETFCEQRYEPLRHRWLRMAVRSSEAEPIAEFYHSSDGNDWRLFCALPTAPFFDMSLVALAAGAQGGSDEQGLRYFFDNIRGRVLPGSPVPAEPESHCAAGVLKEDFEAAVLSPEWDASTTKYGTVKVVGGRLALSVPQQSSQASLSSRRFFDMSQPEAAVQVQLVRPATSPGAKTIWELFHDEEQSLRMVVEGDKLSYVLRRLDPADPAGMDPLQEQVALQTFDPSRPLWLRLKNDGTQLVALTSLDGSQFEEFGSVVLPAFASAVKLRLRADGKANSDLEEDGPFSATALFDDLNP